jgi:hypothetical protein
MIFLTVFGYLHLTLVTFLFQEYQCSSTFNLQSPPNQSVGDVCHGLDDIFYTSEWRSNDFLFIDFDNLKKRNSLTQKS